jgi:hypothetical protein
VSGVRRISSEVAYWIASGVALGGVFAAIAAGVAPHRLRPVAAFLVLWFGGGSYGLLARRAMRRRAARLQRAPLPQGVRLARPLWIPLADSLDVIGIGAALGAVAAAVGFPGVGVGIALAFGVVALAPIIPLLEPAALTFEPTGLRVHVRGGAFVVPWTAVVDVALTGPARHPSANLRVAAPGQILASVSPDTRRTRQRAELLFLLGTPRGQALAFDNWTAGLDSATLARAVREAMGERPPQVN